MPPGHGVHVRCATVLVTKSLGHSSHSSWPSRLLARPGMQGRHAAEALPGWWKPRGQAVHVFEFWLAEKRPAAQVLHCPWPVSLLALPGMQGRHAAELLSGWWKPREQAVHLSAFCLAEKWPDAHTTQESSVAFRRLPALHSEQEELPLLAAVRPSGHGLHAQSSGWSAKVSTAHSWHSAWPVPLLALPGMQGRHAAEVVPGWWKPRGQILHVISPSMS